MKKTILLFIAILAVVELGIAYLFENNKDISTLLLSDQSQTVTAKKAKANMTDVKATENPDSDQAVQEITPLDKYFKYNICVDVSCITSDAHEKEQSNIFAQNLIYFLQQSGFSVGTTNADLSDSDRALKASKYDLVLSLTTDGGYDYYGDADLDSAVKLISYDGSPMRKESEEFKQTVFDSIAFNPNGKYGSRLVVGEGTSDAYPFLKHCKAPAILISAGCYGSEVDLMNDTIYLKILSAYVARGVRNYADVHPKDDVKGNGNNGK